jgi:multiple sugar transport system permease protein
LEFHFELLSGIVCAAVGGGMELNMKVMLKKIGRYMNRSDRAGYFFILPSMIILFMFMLIPLVVSIIFSLLKFDIMWNKVDFAGLPNYFKALKDPRFLNALKNTLCYTLAVVPGEIILGLLVACAIHKKSKINSIFRGVYFLPVICSMTVIGIIWMFLLDPDIGTISYYLSQLGLKPIAFLRTPGLALPTVIIVAIWKDFGFPMVIFIAALNNVPVSYYEAAEIDGAGTVSKFIRITLPTIMPTITFLIISILIKSFQVFDQVQIMTGGGPLRRTETVVQYIYIQGFKNLNMGYASVIAETLFFIILIISVSLFRRLQRSEDNL